MFFVLERRRSRRVPERDPRGAERSNHYSMITTPPRRGSAPPPRGLSADTPPK
jgi:hypothetical protein